MAFYSQLTRFPVLVRPTEKLSKDAFDRIACFKESPNVREQVTAMCALLEIGKQIGNLFSIIRFEKQLTLHPGAVSYIQRLMKALNEKSAMDDISPIDRLQLLKYEENVRVYNHKWTEEEKAIIDKLGILSEEELLRQFAAGPGIEHYVDLIQLRTSV